jgi:hypothetical protein
VVFEVLAQVAYRNGIAFWLWSQDWGWDGDNDDSGKNLCCETQTQEMLPKAHHETDMLAD